MRKYRSYVICAIVALCVVLAYDALKSYTGFSFRSFRAASFRENLSTELAVATSGKPKYNIAARLR